VAVDAFVPRQMAKHGISGLAIALIEDDRVTYVRGYGAAGGGRRMTADIPMPIGSTTKSFTPAGSRQT
jgi:CubicO group peptidase (beta-lactamase class C family)